jgi:hypothetical protein
MFVVAEIQTSQVQLRHVIAWTSLLSHGGEENIINWEEGSDSGLQELQEFYRPITEWY